jgi:hypothetical protein
MAENEQLDPLPNAAVHVAEQEDCALATVQYLRACIHPQDFVRVWLQRQGYTVSGGQLQSTFMSVMSFEECGIDISGSTRRSVQT